MKQKLKFTFRVETLQTINGSHTRLMSVSDYSVKEAMLSVLFRADLDGLTVVKIEFYYSEYDC